MATTSKETQYKLVDNFNLSTPILDANKFDEREAKKIEKFQDLIKKINTREFSEEEERKFILDAYDHFIFRKICDSILANEFVMEYANDLANSNVRMENNGFKNLSYNMSKALLDKYEKTNIDETYLIFTKLTGLNKLFDYTHALISSLIYIPYVAKKALDNKKINEYEYYQFLNILQKLDLNKSIDVYPTNKPLSDMLTNDAFKRYEISENARMKAVEILTNAGETSTIEALGLDKEFPNPTAYCRPVEKTFDMKKTIAEYFRFIEKNVAGKPIRDYITNSIINNLGIVQIAGDGIVPIMTIKNDGKLKHAEFIKKVFDLHNDISNKYTEKINSNAIPKYLGASISVEVMRYGDIYIPEIDNSDNKFMSSTDTNPKIQNMMKMMKDYEYSQVNGETEKK